MKKRMAMLLSASMLAAGTMPVLAETTEKVELSNEAQGMLDLTKEACAVENGIIKFSIGASPEDSDEEVSAVVTVTKYNGNFSVDASVSIPGDEGIQSEYELNDFFRVVDDTAYINCEEILSTIDEATGASGYASILEAFGIPSDGWIAVEELSSFKVDALESDDDEEGKKLLNMLNITENEGSYEAVIADQDILNLLGEIDAFTEANDTEDGDALKDVDLKAMFGKYVDAAVEGIRSVAPDAITDEQVNSMYDMLQSADVADIASAAESVTGENVETEGNSLAQQYQSVLDQGISVNGVLTVGKDEAAGTYAISSDMAVQKTDEEGTQKVNVNVVLSVEPSDEVEEITAPENFTLLQDVIKTASASVYSLYMSNSSETSAE